MLSLECIAHQHSFFPHVSLWISTICSFGDQYRSRCSRCRDPGFNIVFANLKQHASFISLFYKFSGHRHLKPYTFRQMQYWVSNKDPCLLVYHPPAHMQQRSRFPDLWNSHNSEAFCHWTSKLHMHWGSFTATDGIIIIPSPWLRISMVKIAPSPLTWEIMATKFDLPPPAVTIVVPTEHPDVMLLWKRNT